MVTGLNCGEDLTIHVLGCDNGGRRRSTRDDDETDSSGKRIRKRHRHDRANRYNIHTHNVQNQEKQNASKKEE